MVAEKIQNQKMTVAEGIAAVTQRWSELQAEMQRRNAYAMQADAARAAAQQSAQQKGIAAENARTAEWQKAQQEAIAEENAIRRQNAIAEENERRQNVIAAQQNAADRANDTAEAQMWINAF
jgi:hypothetical protein